MIFDRELNAQASATRTGRRHPAIVDVPDEHRVDAYWRAAN
jgi:hypothetical protein